MATKYHGQLTDADGIHEPKGITTAPANSVYVADGAGSGTWKLHKDFVNVSYGCIYLDTTAGTQFTVPTINTKTVLPLSFILDSNVRNFSYDDTTKEITYTGATTIVVTLHVSISISLVGTTSSMLSFYIQKNGTDINGAFITKTFSNNDTGALGMSAIVSVAQNDKLRLVYECDNTETFDATSISLVLLGVVT